MSAEPTYLLGPKCAEPSCAHGQRFHMVGTGRCSATWREPGVGTDGKPVIVKCRCERFLADKDAHAKR